MVRRVALIALAALALAACGQVESGAGLDATPIGNVAAASVTSTALATSTAAPPGSTPDPSAVADMSGDMIVITTTPTVQSQAMPTSTAPSTETDTPAAMPVRPATALPGLQPTFTSVPAGQSNASPDTVTRAQNALATALGVDSQTLSLVQVEDQEWSNSSLGCPSPDQAYMQVIIAGQRIVFSDGANTYAVHTDGQGRRMIWCKGGKPVGLK